MHRPSELTITDHRDRLVVGCGDVPGASHEFHAIWLRDACACAECRRPSTNERLLDADSIPLELTIVEAGIDGDELVVVTSDGHRITLGVEWLFGHAARSDLRSEPAHGVEIPPTGAADIHRFDFAEVSASRLADFLDALLKTGAALARGMPTTHDALIDLAERIGPIRPTNYGRTWSIEATVEPVSEVDSDRALRVHTDLPYREVAPGLQLLLACVTDVDGGATTLVDGYATAEHLRLADQSAWSLLSRVEFAYPFHRSDAHHDGRAPLIGLRPDGSYHQIRRAPDLVGSPYVDAADTPALFAALRRWNAMLDDPANETRIALVPGDLLAFDNHRMLHGRSAFDLGASGARSLIGCYLDGEDVRSRHALLGRAT